MHAQVRSPMQIGEQPVLILPVFIHLAASEKALNDEVAGVPTLPHTVCTAMVLFSSVELCLSITHWSTSWLVPCQSCFLPCLHSISGFQVLMACVQLQFCLPKSNGWAMDRTVPAAIADWYLLWCWEEVSVGVNINKIRPTVTGMSSTERRWLTCWHGVLPGSAGCPAPILGDFAGAGIVSRPWDTGMLW